MSGQTFALILIGAGLVIAALWLRELLLDFAERQFADEFGGDASHGDRPHIPDDLKIRNHAERIAR